MKKGMTAVLAIVLVVASMVPVLYAPAATHAQDFRPIGAGHFPERGGCHIKPLCDTGWDRDAAARRQRL